MPEFGKPRKGPSRTRGLRTREERAGFEHPSFEHPSMGRDAADRLDFFKTTVAAGTAGTRWRDSMGNWLHEFWAAS
jgi:hypothetical protein